MSEACGYCGQFQPTEKPCWGCPCRAKEEDLSRVEVDDPPAMQMPPPKPKKEQHAHILVDPGTAAGKWIQVPQPLLPSGWEWIYVKQ